MTQLNADELDRLMRELGFEKIEPNTALDLLTPAEAFVPDEEEALVNGCFCHGEAFGLKQTIAIDSAGRKWEAEDHIPLQHNGFVKGDFLLSPSEHDGALA